MLEGLGNCGDICPIAIWFWSIPALIVCAYYICIRLIHTKSLSQRLQYPNPGEIYFLPIYVEFQ